MTEIVKRLRDQQTKLMTPILGQAADEIERLRSALTEIAEFEPTNPHEDRECQAIAADALK